MRVLPHQLWLGRGNSAQQAALGYTSPHHGASDCCAQTFRGSSARQTDVRPCTPLCADVPILQQLWHLLACTTTLASTSTCTFLASGAQLFAACTERVGVLLAGAVPGRLLSHHLPFCLHCSSATNRLIHAKDKASVQLNIGHVSGARRTLLLLPAVCERAEMRHASAIGVRVGSLAAMAFGGVPRGYHIVQSGPPACLKADTFPPGPSVA